ncbi:MAG TPA: PAS domain S-box protein [Pyrinomonadaceae bacterium]|jgi:PAS domain S-box-containing protein
MSSEPPRVDLPDDESKTDTATELTEGGLARYWLSAIIESAEDAIISKTLDGIITSWNKGAERIFGYTAEEIIGRPVVTLIPQDHQDEEPKILARLRRGERIEHYETVRAHKDGTLLNISLTVSPIRGPGGQIIGASKIARDITKQKQAEEERERLFVLEQQARAGAEEANRLKDEFLATVSHELRTPLTSILGYSKMLRAGILGEKEKAHAVDAIERNARAQAQIVNDILEVSRIITGKLRLNLQQISPVTAVESAIDAVRPAAGAKGLRLITSLDLSVGSVMGDPDRLQQIAWNLLSNAVKFTPAGGRVEVRLEEVDGQVQLKVSDTGIGIAPKFLPFVFDRFRQADSSITRSHGGLGLGLALVRYLSELHGGAVKAESPGEGLGATFIVTFPLAESDSAVDPSGPALARNSESSREEQTHGSYPKLQGLSVLIVDDEEDTRKMLRMVFEQCGAEVRTAASAREALKVIEQWMPGVMVCDIGMPGEDGYSLIRKVRAAEAGRDEQTPALALTGYARSEDRVQALSAGYQMHMAKPIDPLELTAAVATLSKRVPIN